MIDLERIEGFGSPGQRAAAQTMLALATLEPGDAPIDVKLTDSPQLDGRIEIHGHRVDVADALVAGATVIATALGMLGSSTALVVRRDLGAAIAWSETIEER